ncbi:MAG: arsenate reductase ArsC [Acidobacteria bacterium]|nr:arsenate reductase ArsC [Acidobacteriota bacterium]
MKEIPGNRNSLKVLFVCLGNSCRSQMAEGLARKLAPGWDVFSAGLLPAGYVSPGAIAALREIDIDISGHCSKGLDEVNLDAMQVIISVGSVDTADFVSCLDGKIIEHWDIADPMGHRERFFKIVRDQIESKVKVLIARLVERAT